MDDPARRHPAGRTDASGSPRAGRGARRVALLAPPLVVAGVVALLLSRSRGFDERVRVEDDVRSRWALAGAAEAVRADVERYLAKNGEDPEARWFAAEAFARTGDLGRAHAVVWDHPATAEDPGAPARFATLVLERLGERVGPWWPRVLLLRAELDLPGARESLRRETARPEMTGGAFLLLYESAHRGGPAARTLLSDALRARAEAVPEGFRVRLAAAALTTGPRERGDLPLLLRGLSEPEVRRDLLAWRQVVRALGAARTTEASDALREALGDATFPPERDALVVGLALAEEPGYAERVLERAGGAEPAGHADAGLYAGGLVARATQGDASALARMPALWSEARTLLVHVALGSGMLLADAPAPPELPTDAWAADLRAHSEPALRALALAHDWRTGRADPRDLARALGEALSAPELLSAGSDGLSGPLALALEVCRAWLRWPSPTPR